MFIFFTIILLMISLYSLVKGNMFNKTLLEIEEYEKQKEDDIDKSKSTEILIKSIWLVVFAIGYFITYLTYLINALKVDIYTYPTFIMLMLFLTSFVINLIKNKQPNNERKMRRLKKERTLKRTIINSIEATYFLYMLMMAIFY
ncbi:hypothetical protein [Bacillus smithii]|uniref:hypothetical protein n=1 Tax=Bacillus smithii TaxID=1479 RepID=UPI003D1DF077